MYCKAAILKQPQCSLTIIPLSTAKLPKRNSGWVSEGGTEKREKRKKNDKNCEELQSRQPVTWSIFERIRMQRAGIRATWYVNLLPVTWFHKFYLCYCTLKISLLYNLQGTQLMNWEQKLQQHSEQYCLPTRLRLKAKPRPWATFYCTRYTRKLQTLRRLQTDS
jgi:hypothetical protein